MGALLKAWLARLLSLQKRWLGVVVAILVWLIWMLFGFWALILLIVLGVLGYTIGFALERGITLRDVLDKIVSRRDN